MVDALPAELRSRGRIGQHIVDKGNFARAASHLGRVPAPLRRAARGRVVCQSQQTSLFRLHRHMQSQSSLFLQVAKDGKQISGLGIAIRAEHAD